MGGTWNHWYIKLELKRLYKAIATTKNLTQLICKDYREQCYKSEIKSDVIFYQYQKVPLFSLDASRNSIYVF